MHRPCDLIPTEENRHLLSRKLGAVYSVTPSWGPAAQTGAILFQKEETLFFKNDKIIRDKRKLKNCSRFKETKGEHLNN